MTFRLASLMLRLTMAFLFWTQTRDTQNYTQSQNVAGHLRNTPAQLDNATTRPVTFSQIDICNMLFLKHFSLVFCFCWCFSLMLFIPGASLWWFFSESRLKEHRFMMTPVGFNVIYSKQIGHGIFYSRFTVSLILNLILSPFPRWKYYSNRNLLDLLKFMTLLKFTPCNLFI